VSDAVCLLDVGNSGTKWLAVDASNAVVRGRCDTEKMVDTLSDQLRGAVVLVSSVAAIELQDALAVSLGAKCKQLWFAQSRETLDGLVNSYADPQRMGVDRWLAMLAAYRRVSGRLCVVDAGSALTIDLVAAQGQHEGGFIIPGTALMQRALFSDTGRVRYSMSSDSSLAPGCSTAEAVNHGLLLAQVGAVKLAMERASMQGETPALLLCGGGALELAKVLELPHTLAPTLIFEGLLLQAQQEVPGMLDFEDLASTLFAL